MSTKRANKSSVWDHMTKSGGNKVKCNVCAKEMIYAKSSSTTTMMYHLRTCHPSVFEDAKQAHPSQPSLSTFGVGPQRPCNDSRQEKITALLVKFIVANMLPLSLVENAEFGELMRFLEPNYKVPVRKTVQTRLDSMKGELAKKVQGEMESAPAVHLTTDLWTSVANDAYIGVTASYINDDWQLKARTLANKSMEERHTQANISSRLGDIAASWQLESKVKAVVHDGASNMKEVASANSWTDINCSAHKLHLAVTGMYRSCMHSNQMCSYMIWGPPVCRV